MSIQESIEGLDYLKSLDLEPDVIKSLENIVYAKLSLWKECNQCEDLYEKALKVAQFHWRSNREWSLDLAIDYTCELIKVGEIKLE